MDGSGIRDTSVGALKRPEMGSGASSSRGKKFASTYILAGELGKGAFSIVRLGVNKSTGAKVAVKIVQKKELNAEDLASLREEITILSSIDHKNIIKLFEFFDEGTEMYLITELVEGGELFDRIVAKSSYSEKEARDVIKVVLETMAFLHKSDIAHRDLKPENLILCGGTFLLTGFQGSSPRPQTTNPLLTLDTSRSMFSPPDSDTDIKLADFGFAKKISLIQEKEVACGTPGYVAPEILRGDKYGGEVDVWSIGVICYILLAGYPPFYDDDSKKLFKKIKEGRYYFHDEHWSNASPESMDIIRKMLTVSQTERWSAQQLLSHPWITKGDSELAAIDRSSAIVNYKKFNARRRLRAAADAIIVTNRIKKMIDSVKARKEVKSQKEIVSLVRREDAANSDLVDLSADDNKKGPLAILESNDSATGELLSNDSSLAPV